MAMVDLKFRGAYTPPAADRVDLRFGQLAVGSTVTGAMEAVSPGSVATITGALLVLGDLAATSPASTIAAAGLVDINVFRGPSPLSGDNWQPAKPHATNSRSVNARPEATPNRIGLLWQPASSLAGQVTGDFTTPPAMPARVRAIWDEADDYGASNGSGYQIPPAVPMWVAGGWQEGQGEAALSGSVYENPPPMPAWRTGLWQHAARRGRSTGGSFQPAIRREILRGLRWQLGWPVWGPGAFVPLVIVPPTAPPFSGDVRLQFDCPLLPCNRYMDFARRCCAPREPVAIPILRTYFVSNAVSLIRLRDGQAVPVLSASLSLDAGTWAWAVEVSTTRTALSLIDAREELQLTINGQSVWWLAERWGGQRSFGSAQTIKLSGRSIHAELSDPYFSASSGVVDSPMTARQLADAAIDNTGYTLDWQLTDWLVPAGAWSWDGLTPMGRITRLAEAAGGIVFGQPGERVLSVLPRTPVMPEAWAAATPDLILPDAVMETLGEEWDETPVYNAVIVTGERNGITARVKRTGTAGDAIAPTIVDALITHPDPARYRGMDVLAQGGSAARVSVSLPMLDGLGLVLPGTLVSVTGADPFRAMSRGVRVSAEWKDALVVRQTLDLERRA